MKIKFRQKNGRIWHYWGFLYEGKYGEHYTKGVFTPPIREDTNSYQSIGIKDFNGKEIFLEDVVDDRRLDQSEIEQLKVVSFQSGSYVLVNLLSWNSADYIGGYDRKIDDYDCRNNIIKVVGSLEMNKKYSNI
jgi:hypothetical protein